MEANKLYDYEQEPDFIREQATDTPTPHIGDRGPFGGSRDLPSSIWPDTINPERAAAAFKRRTERIYDQMSELDT